MHFSKYPSYSELFQSFYLSKRVDGREISSDLLEPLKIRLDSVAKEATHRLTNLHRMQVHYRLLANIEALNQKMEFWKSGESASAVRKWIDEYKVTIVVLCRFRKIKIKKNL